MAIERVKSKSKPKRTSTHAFADKDDTGKGKVPGAMGVETTGTQTASIMQGGMGSFETGGEGYGAPPPGTYTMYRQMRCYPTIAIARSIATAPTRLAAWAFEASDTAPSDARDFIAEHLESHRSQLLHHLLYGLDYGFQSFEKVIGTDEQGRWIYKKIKPLVPDGIELRYDQFGTFAGLKQGRATLDTVKCFVYSYDVEGSDLYGRSRMENLRKHIWPAISKLAEREGQYVQKAAGVMPIIRYPDGSAEDASGKTVSTFEMAKALSRDLGKLKGIVMPRTLAKWVERLALKGVTNPDALEAWRISFLEAAQQHGAEFVQLGDRYDRLIFRGWLCPERTGMEGTHGTKAEAESHANVSLMVAELFLQEICRYINWYLINPLLVWNYGPKAENTVTLKTEKLIDEQKLLLRSIMSTVLSGNPMLLEELLNMDVILEMLDLPSKEQADAMTSPELATEEEVEGLLTRVAQNGNAATEEAARDFAALARWVSWKTERGNGREVIRA